MALVVFYGKVILVHKYSSRPISYKVTCMLPWMILTGSCLCACSETRQPTPSRDVTVILPIRGPSMRRDEGQVEECCQDASRKGKRRVLRARQTTSAATGHHEPAGQGVDHTTYDELPQDESGLSRRSVMCWCAGCFYVRTGSDISIDIHS